MPEPLPSRSGLVVWSVGTLTGVALGSEFDRVTACAGDAGLPSTFIAET